MHGKNDDFVRFQDDGKLVYNAAPKLKDLVLVKNAVHNDIPYVMGKENYLNTLRN